VGGKGKSGGKGPVKGRKTLAPKSVSSKSPNDDDATEDESDYASHDSEEEDYEESLGDEEEYYENEEYDEVCSAFITSIWIMGSIRIGG
jgi:hypothetical protein